jgi:hypothetical protein
MHRVRGQQTVLLPLEKIKEFTVRIAYSGADVNISESFTVQIK